MQSSDFPKQAEIVIIGVGGIVGSMLAYWLAELGQKNNREVFDARLIGNRITLRHWSPGDRFQPIGNTGEKKLQDLFVNQKIPLSERHRRAMGESYDGRLFWINGLRIADPFKVTESTTELLIFHWKE